MIVPNFTFGFASAKFSTPNRSYALTKLMCQVKKIKNRYCSFKIAINLFGISKKYYNNKTISVMRPNKFYFQTYIIKKTRTFDEKM